MSPSSKPSSPLSSRIIIKKNYPHEHLDRQSRQSKERRGAIGPDDSAEWSPYGCHYQVHRRHFHYRLYYDEVGKTINDCCNDILVCVDCFRMFFQHQPDLEEFPLPKMDTLPDDPLKVILKNFGKVNRQVAKFWQNADFFTIALRRASNTSWTWAETSRRARPRSPPPAIVDQPSRSLRRS